MCSLYMYVDGVYSERCTAVNATYTGVMYYIRYLCMINDACSCKVYGVDSRMTMGVAGMLHVCCDSCGVISWKCMRLQQ